MISDKSWGDIDCSLSRTRVSDVKKKRSMFYGNVKKRTTPMPEGFKEDCLSGMRIVDLVRKYSLSDRVVERLRNEVEES